MGNKVDLNRLMWLALGAGSKGVVGGMVGGFVPEAGITPDIATAVVGFIIAQQGGERVGTFGEGMLIASIGQIVRDPIESMIQKFQNGGNGGTGAKATTKLTEGNTGGGQTSMQQYMNQAYGVQVA